MARLINGNSVQGITAQTDADFYGGIAGGVTGILAIGRRMEAEVVNNTPRIYDGTLLTKEGRRVQIDYGSYDDFTIPAGTEGVTRYFLIGYKLTTESSGAQTCSTFVEASTASGTIEEHMLKDGYTDAYISLYRVTQTGTVNTISDCLRPLFRPLGTAGTEESDVQTTTLQWNRLTVTISIYRESVVFVSVTGTPTADIDISMKWTTITTRNNICPASDAVGFVIINIAQTVKYRWTSSGVFQIGYCRSLDETTPQAIRAGLGVDFNFSFMI